MTEIISEPHIVRSPRSEYDYYRALQMAEGKLFAMTVAKNEVLEALKARPLMWNENHSELCVSDFLIKQLIAKLENVG